MASAWAGYDTSGAGTTAYNYGPAAEGSYGYASTSWFDAPGLIGGGCVDGQDMVIACGGGRGLGLRTSPAL